MAARNLAGLQTLAIPRTLDGLQTIQATAVYINGSNVNPNALAGANYPLFADGNLNVNISKSSGNVDGYLGSNDYTNFNSKLSQISASAPLSVSSLSNVSISQAGSSSNGFLSSSDWTTFNSKQAQILASAPLTITSLSNLSIAQAGASSSGYLNSSDWTTFNVKQSQITVASPLTLTSLSNVSISQASASSSGYLSSADWTAFNSKGSGTITSLNANILVTSLSNIQLNSNISLSNVTAKTYSNLPIPLTTNQLGVVGFSSTFAVGASSTLAGGFQWSNDGTLQVAIGSGLFIPTAPSASAGQVSLSQASSSALGGVKYDGTTLTLNGSSQLIVNSQLNPNTSYPWFGPIQPSGIVGSNQLIALDATSTNAGVVYPDGNLIAVGTGSNRAKLSLNISYCWGSSTSAPSSSGHPNSSTVWAVGASVKNVSIANNNQFYPTKVGVYHVVVSYFTYSSSTTSQTEITLYNYNSVGTIVQQTSGVAASAPGAFFGNEATANAIFNVPSGGYIYVSVRMGNGAAAGAYGSATIIQIA